MTPSTVTRYHSASHTHVGMVRKINEDAVSYTHLTLPTNREV